MERRLLLKLSAVLALAPSITRATTAPGPAPRVAVIGGGIVGCSIAYQLAKAGAAVTLLERDQIARQASYGTFAWINATWAKQPRSYHHFNQLGLQHWHELGRELDIPIVWGGSLEWFESEDRQRRLEEDIDEQIKWGEPASMLDAKQMAALEPRLTVEASTRAAYSAADGAVNPVEVCHRLVKSARRLGAQFHEGVAVDEVQIDEATGNCSLLTSDGELTVDRYVIATGADPFAIEKLAAVAVPQRSTPGVIVVTKPVPPLLSRIVVAPGVHMHQRADGRIVLGEQDGVPAGGSHATRLADRPTRFPNDAIASQHAERLMALARRFIQGLETVEVDE
ncbi:MAG: FAD-binding oxidoreductase, partial [Luminiphilus sp.]|nr:FAD-binding oxidoreductase [Luminiphilus sp.]